jgi:hypothetical protein
MPETWINHVSDYSFFPPSLAWIMRSIEYLEKWAWSISKKIPAFI